MRFARFLHDRLISLGWVDWAFLALLFAAYVNTATPMLSPDSGGYLPSGEEISDPSGLAPAGEGWGSISFVGDAFRTWPPTLFYWLVPSAIGNVGRSWVQVACVAAVTVFFARSGTKWLRPGPAVLARGLIYAVALSGAALSFNLLIGAEGPAYIFGLLAAGAVLATVWRYQRDGMVWQVWTGLSLAWVAALLLSITRITGIPFLLAVSALIIFLLWSQRRKAVGRRLLTVGAFGALTVLGALYAGFVSSNQSVYWKPASDRSIRLVFALAPSVNPEFAGSLVAALPPDAPSCLRAIGPEVKEWGQVTSLITDECGAKGQDWINANYTSVFLRYWITDPGSAKSWAVRGSELASDGAQDPRVTSPMPAVVRSLAFSNPPDTNVALALGVAWLVALVLLIIRRMRRHVARPSLTQSFFLVVLGAGAWVSFVASYMDLWGAHARKAWPFYFLVLVLSLLALTSLIGGKLRPEDDSGGQAT